MANKRKTCSSCQPKITQYLDRATDLERRLRLLANLLVQVNPPDGLDQEAAEQLGAEISDYLERLRVVRHYFFGVELQELNDEALVKSMLIWLDLRANPSEANDE